MDGSELRNSSIRGELIFCVDDQFVDCRFCGGTLLILFHFLFVSSLENAGVFALDRSELRNLSSRSHLSV